MFGLGEVEHEREYFVLIERFRLLRRGAIALRMVGEYRVSVPFISHRRCKCASVTFEASVCVLREREE